jgi:hypothetical protein
MTSFKRAIGAAAVTAVLASSTAIAAEVTPLPAGKPAGVKQADLLGAPFVLIGIAVVAAIVAISVSGNDDNKPTTPTTNSTSTTGTGA